MRSRLIVVAILLFTGGFPDRVAAQADGRVTGELKQWHCVTITFDGPKTSESAKVNPFRDYRLNVAFTNEQSKQHLIVPGYFAADGKAGESGASEGNKWRVHFAPPAEGRWYYEASFRTGKDVAVSLDRVAGEATGFDAAKGSFIVGASDKTGRDMRYHGALQYVGKRYLQFAGSKQFFLKGGADSPENFLGYIDFDNTYKTNGDKKKNPNTKSGLHEYQPHLKDWQQGDPTWRGGKGKGIIGALNYLSAQGMNSVYFLTMNVTGDGKDVWPWTKPDERHRFDCSKLDQWETVFAHMTARGISQYVITQETENDQLLDGGDLGIQRKLYYRELIARFAHHPALIWNLGEENTNTDAQRKAFCDYIHELDAYDHAITCHTYPGQYDKVYGSLLGYKTFEGLSVQTNADVTIIHELTKKWLLKSEAAGRPWVIFIDEPGSAQKGVTPDGPPDNNHDEMRIHALWGSLMAGSSGVEWYFGYKYPHNDLNLEDWRSRHDLWRQTRVALEFFQKLPLDAMYGADQLVEGNGATCFAKPGETLVVHLPKGGTTKLNVGESDATWTVRWYDPRQGGNLQVGSISRIMGKGTVSIGEAPKEKKRDWIVLIQCDPKKKASSAVDVKNGLGGGLFLPGAIVPIHALTPPGKAFSNWTVSPAERGGETLGLADARAASTSFQTRAGKATITAHFTAAPPKDSQPTLGPNSGSAKNATGTGRIVSATLINADTNQPIVDFAPIKDGATLDLSKLPTRKLNIRADTKGNVTAVRFELNGDMVQTENVAPFALAGDSNSDYKPWTPSVGQHTLKLVGGKGKPLTLRFNVIDSR